MLRCTLIAVVLSLLALPAHAYDLLYSGDLAVTHERGSFGIEGAILRFSSDRWFEGGKLTDGSVMIRKGVWFKDDDSSFSLTAIPVDVRYSPLGLLEVGATGVFLLQEMSDFADEDSGYVNPLPDFESQGVGDTWLWAKYNFSPEPLMSLRVGYKLPTGEDRPDVDELPTGSGQADIDGAIMFAVPAGPGWVDAAIGYRIRTKREADTSDSELDSWPYGTYEFKPGNEVHFYAGYAQLVGKSLNVRVGADGSFGSDYESGREVGGTETGTTAETGASLVCVNPGIDYLLGNDIWLGFDLHYPVMGTNVNAAWGFGLSVGWGM
jgi:hypothetical protein